MGTNDKTVDNLEKPSLLQETDSSPEGGFTTPWLLCDLGFFRINVTIISPQAEQPQGYFPLSRSQAEYFLKRVADIVKLLKEQLR